METREKKIKELKKLLHLTYNEDGKYILSWKKPYFMTKSIYESSEISKEDFIRIGKFLIYK